MHDKTTKEHSVGDLIAEDESAAKKITGDIFADLEATLNEVAETNPRINLKLADGNKTTTDLQALLTVSQAVNSSLVLDDVLQIVMQKAIELMQAERGLIMLLDDDSELQIRTAHNLGRKEMMQEEFRISNSVVTKVAKTGKSIYASDAQSDARYAEQASVVELNLRSIMCVPIKEQGCVIGVIYVDNSNQTRMFLKSDLYLFELYAQAVAGALRNAAHYDSLLKLKKYNESVINLSPIGMVVVDDGCNVATINTTALEILEINIDEVTALGDEEPLTPFLELLQPDERSRWRNMIDTALSTNEDFSDPRYFHNTGYIEKVLSIKISPTSALPKGDTGLIITIEDITEKVLMEKYVILSEKLAAKGEMAASIAHELNNYLAIAATNAELMGMNLDRDKFDKARFNAKSIVDNIFKIKRFVDNLMAFAQPEPEYISYDIKHLIEDMLFSLRVQPRLKRIHFTIDLGRAIPNLEMDVGQIQQVLMNLLNNAADAIEERAIAEQAVGNDFKREIGIIAGYNERSGLVSIDVTDNGVGMAQEILSKLFTPHFTTKKGGHGLGLSNCRKIVESHQGKLTAKSTLGHGSTFTLTLPHKLT
ncbi:MAG: ATP-binding protein [candidate division Zixibacteria bacterium]|nr:ATP-binding protein [candidate division Zixibacteria bacterium]MDH3938266.1 ATP-binding protein [candidate division Zixibacteria bacterium]MDH4035403.1 ATP-binding protein [candidate division Zixibacteria bacterium]